MWILYNDSGILYDSQKSKNDPVILLLSRFLYTKKKKGFIMKIKNFKEVKIYIYINIWITFK